MATIEYIIPVVYTAEDNNSYVNRDSILIKDCSQLGNPSPECDGYNFNKCPNDDAYCQPFIKGDILRFQYRIDITKYFKIFISFINSVTGEEESVVFTTQTGHSEDLTQFLNVIVDTNQDIFDTLTCWYMKVKLYGCKLDGTNPYQLCVDEKLTQGLTLYEAQAECYEEQCNIADFIATEPFCVLRCDEKSLLICGEYVEFDCDGNYYGNLIQPSQQESINQFKNCFRIRGVIEPNGYTFSKTESNNKTIKSQQREAFLLIGSVKTPYYVAQQLAIAFNSKKMTIDGIEYKGGVKIDKNFDEGLNWIIRENIFIECDEINFTCD